MARRWVYGEHDPAERPVTPLTPWPPPGLSAPARRALAGAGIVDLEHLAARTEKEVLALHGMGPKAMAPLRAALAAAGLAFAQETTEAGRAGS